MLRTEDPVTEGGRLFPRPCKYMQGGCVEAGLSGPGYSFDSWEYKLRDLFLCLRKIETALFKDNAADAPITFGNR